MWSRHVWCKQPGPWISAARATCMRHLPTLSHLKGSDKPESLQNFLRYKIQSPNTMACQRWLVWCPFIESMSFQSTAPKQREECFSSAKPLPHTPARMQPEKAFTQNNQEVQKSVWRTTRHSNMIEKDTGCSDMGFRGSAAKSFKKGCPPNTQSDHLQNMQRYSLNE